MTRNDHVPLPARAGHTVNTNGKWTATFGTASLTSRVQRQAHLHCGGWKRSPAVVGRVTQQAPGAIFKQNSLNGNYAFMISGANAAGNITTVGSFSSAGSGLLLNGVLDENSAGTVTVRTRPKFTEPAVSNTGRGTATLNSMNRTYTLVFYLDGLGGGVLQETDSAITSHGVLAQQQAVSISAGYALSPTGSICLDDPTTC